MDEGRARTLLSTERAEVERLLRDTVLAAQQDRAAELGTGDSADQAQPLTAEGADDAVAVGLRDRLAAFDRAQQRLELGTFGRSILSGLSIPDERLDADLAAELTVDEAKVRLEEQRRIVL
jgi:DnaK suppressor protein